MPVERDIPHPHHGPPPAPTRLLTSHFDAVAGFRRARSPAGTGGYPHYLT